MFDVINLEINYLAQMKQHYPGLKTIRQLEQTAYFSNYLLPIINQVTGVWVIGTGRRGGGGAAVHRLGSPRPTPLNRLNPAEYTYCIIIPLHSPMAQLGHALTYSLRYLPVSDIHRPRTVSRNTIYLTIIIPLQFLVVL